MEQQALYLRLFEICEQMRFDAKQHHAAKPATAKTDLPPCATSKTDANGGAPHHPRDPLKMPPSARGVLRVLLQQSPLNQRTIAGILHLTAPAVSEAVKKLEGRGLLTRVHGEFNNEYRLALTEQGKDIARQMDEKAKRDAAKLFCNFTQDELDTLAQLLEKMGENATAPKCQTPTEPSAH